MSSGGAAAAAVEAAGIEGALDSGGRSTLVDAVPDDTPSPADRATLSRRNSFISMVLAVVLDGSRLSAFCSELHASLL